MEDETVINSNKSVDENFFMAIIQEILYSPLNMALIAIITFLIYKIVRDRFEIPNIDSSKPPEPELPKLRKDFTVKELRQYDGTQPDGRVLIAVNGTVFDVTKGKRFYGPGGPYASFAGRDASRNLATFSVAAIDNEEYDDLSDLGAMEMDQVREWEMQFREKYYVVGKLLRKGEQPTNYDDEEDEADNKTIIDSKLKNIIPATATTTTTTSEIVTKSVENLATESTAINITKQEDTKANKSIDDGIRKSQAMPSMAEEIK